MRRSACSLSLAALVPIAGILLTTSDARAQDTGAPPPVAPAQGAAPAPAPAPPPRDEEEDPGGRLRIGWNINGGYGTSSGLSGPTFGGTFRIGWQLNRLMGVYGNISPLVFVGSSSGLAAGASIGAIAGTQLTPMFSLTPVDLLEIAAGPSADYLTGGGVSGGPGGSTVGGFSSVYFGVHGRLALHTGGRNPETGRRKGFAIGADVHPTFTSGSSITFITLGLGMDWF